MFCIPSHNNERYTRKCLSSAFSQVGEFDFRVIFVDDFSADNTVQVARDVNDEYADSQTQSFTLIENGKHRGPMSNIWTMIHSCDPDEIVCCLDGDDWLKHERVLERVAREYDAGALLTYGNTEILSDPKRDSTIHKCPDPIINSRSYRQQSYYWSALRTFYAGLTQRIKIEHVTRDNAFLEATSDQAIMHPMLELVGHDQAFIPDILYVYNDMTGQNDFKVRAQVQLDCEAYVRSCPKYTELSREEKNNLRGT